MRDVREDDPCAALVSRLSFTKRSSAEAVAIVRLCSSPPCAARATNAIKSSTCACLAEPFPKKTGTPPNDEHHWPFLVIERDAPSRKAHPRRQANATAYHQSAAAALAARSASLSTRCSAP